MAPSAHRSRSRWGCALGSLPPLNQPLPPFHFVPVRLVVRSAGVHVVKYGPVSDMPSYPKAAWMLDLGDVLAPHLLPQSQELAVLFTADEARAETVRLNLTKGIHAVAVNLI